MADAVQTGRKRATIGDVARMAGVSRSAVSRTFTPGASASAATAARVTAAADALGYRPNLVARSLSTRRSRIVGVAISRLENSFHADLLQALCAGLQALEHRCLLFLLDRDDADPPLDEVLRHQVDAVVLCAVRLTSSFAEECRRVGVPVLLLNRLADVPGVPAVVGDNAGGGRTVAAFLAAGGHRRPAFLAGIEESSTSRDREAGFAAGLRAAGLPAALRETGLFDPAHAAAAVRRLLTGAAPPDALFCANDHMAIAALDVARREFGLKPGHDISVVGFDDSRPAGWSGTALTSYAQPAERMATDGVALLRDLLAARSPASLRLVVPGTLVIRESARRPDRGCREEEGRTVWRDDRSDA